MLTDLQFFMQWAVPAPAALAQAQRVALAFRHTAELAKSLCQQQATDSQLEEYREILRTAIAFYRRRRSLHRRLAMIPETE